MTRSKVLGVCLAAFLAAGATAHADTVTLKSGKKFEGEVLSEDDKGVVIKTSVGKLTLPRYQVKSVEKGAVSGGSGTPSPSSRSRGGSARRPGSSSRSGSSRSRAPSVSRSRNKPKQRKPADPAEVRALLAKMTGDTDGTRRGNAARRLGTLGKGDPTIVEQILPALMKTATTDGNMSTRQNASGALLGLGKPAVAPLSRMLVGSNREQKRVAADALSKLYPRDVVDAIPALTRALDDSSREVRMRAVATIGGMARDSTARRDAGAEVLAVVLTRALDDKDEMLRNQAAGHLGALGAAGEAGLAKARQDKSSMVRSTASKATVGSASSKSLPELVKQLGDPNPDMQKAALDRIAKKARGDKLVARDAISVFGHVMNDTKRTKKVRYQAISGFVQILKKHKDAAVVIVPKLQEASKASPELRERIVGALSWCGKWGIPLLEKLVMDKDPDVRKAAKATLKRVDHGRAR